MPPALRALPLTALDLGVAVALYRLVSPPLGLLLGAVGALLLVIVLGQLSQSAVERFGFRPAR
jgi:hypothetical protein